MLDSLSQLFNEPIILTIQKFQLPIEHLKTLTHPESLFKIYTFWSSLPNKSKSNMFSDNFRFFISLHTLYLKNQSLFYNSGNYNFFHLLDFLTQHLSRTKFRNSNISISMADYIISWLISSGKSFGKNTTHPISYCICSYCPRANVKYWVLSSIPIVFEYS